MKSSFIFSIPIAGMADGIHQYHFTIDEKLLEGRENLPFEHMNMEVDLKADRRADTITLHFDFQGEIDCSCDRCTADIQLPIDRSYELILRLMDIDRDDEDDIIYRNVKDPRLFLDELFYDYIVLAVPISKTYDCDSDSPRPCDDSVLKLLESDDEEEEDSDGLDEPNIWDELKSKISK